MIFKQHRDLSPATIKQPAGKLRRLALVLLALCMLCGCANTQEAMQDGYYTAEAADFDQHGWKEYVTIYVSGNRIITVEYNASNSSGFIKSWDMDYMRTMHATDGTYPNKYTREYADALLNRQEPYKVDVITGATHSHISFQLLAEAAIARSKNADTTIAYVDIPIIEDEEDTVMQSMGDGA